MSLVHGCKLTISSIIFLLFGNFFHNHNLVIACSLNSCCPIKRFGTQETYSLISSSRFVFTRIVFHSYFFPFRICASSVLTGSHLSIDSLWFFSSKFCSVASFVRSNHFKSSFFFFCEKVFKFLIATIS